MTAKFDHQDIVYYNATLFAPTSGGVIPAAVSDIRGTPIIETPEHWQASVVRFDISSSLLPPVTLPMPGPPVLGPNVPTSLVVTLRYLGVSYPATVLINCRDLASYGDAYSIDDVVARINAAFAVAYAAIPAPPASAAPAFGFDAVSQLISLYFQDTYNGASPIEIYVNSALYNYVLSIPADFYGFNLPSGLDFRFKTYETSATRLVAAAPRTGLPVIVNTMAGNVLSLVQEGSSLQAWSGARSIVITTSMPINPEALPQSSLLSQNQSYSSNSIPILSDFLLSTNPGENPVVDRINIAYLPSAEYRMIQLKGREALKRVDLKFFYTKNDGTLRELFLPPGGHASAKIMFRRSRE